MLSKYKIQEIIEQRSTTIVYRAQRNSDGQEVALKCLKNNTPDLKEIRRLETEYEITKNLNCPGIVQCYGLESDGNGLALVLEYFGGQSLSQYLSSHEISLEQFLTIAISLADTLSQLHSLPLIHKDIKPSNIIINPETQQVKLTDFSLATRLPFEYPAAEPPHVMEGTLAYMSPEQTGRMNRYLDHRSDLYSLGVTFYEMLTGQLPFTSSDPLELIHSHLAISPTPPHHYRSLPLTLSNLILKMMAKTPEEGYRSAQGVKIDLETCFTQLQETGMVETFRLGQRDRADYLLLSQKLYGRDTQIQTLFHYFNQICEGNPALVLVSGSPGIGKTFIVREIYKPLIKARGYFISGKFEQLRQDTPYAAIIEAFRNLIQQILTESQRQLEQWKQQLQMALGNNGQIIIDLIPELELLIGQQPDVPELSGTSAQNRFHRVFHQFVQVFCQPQHPLVVFLDDLQWADFASLQLLKNLISEQTNQYLLLIGAYRDQEVNLSHPLLQVCDQLQTNGTPIEQITVPPLTIENVNELVSDSLQHKADSEKIEQLSQLVYQKTQGNPFFVNQFLTTLYEENLLQYHIQYNRWDWDLEAIKTIGITDGNIVELLIRNLQKLPKETQEILKLAACIGNQFNLELLAIINQEQYSVALKKLWSALEAGLILTDSNNELTRFQEGDMNYSSYYNFLHDRIQQAAYALIPESEKKETHLKIGKLLLAKMPSELQEQNIFTLVNQLNFGADQLNLPSDQQQLIELNLKATHQSKSANAYKFASHYLKQARQLLPSDCWKKHYELTVQIYWESAEVEATNADYKETLAFCQIGKQNANNNLEIAQFLREEIKVYFSRNEVEKVVETGEEALNLLGVKLVNEPPQEFDVNHIAKLPRMTNPSMLLVMEILNSIFPSACFSEHPLALSILYTMLDISGKHGNSIPAIFGYALYGGLLIRQFQIDLAYEIGNLALYLLDKLNAKSVWGKTLTSIYLIIFYLKHHLQESVQALSQASQYAIEVGDIEYACSAASYSCEYALFQGKYLDRLDPEFTKTIHFLKKNQQEHQSLICQIPFQFMAALQEKSTDQASLKHTFLKESKLEKELRQKNNQMQLFRLQFYKGWLHYLFGEIDNASKHFSIGSPPHIRAEVIFTEYITYYSLTLLAKERPSEQDLQLVEENQALISIWADHAPMNFQHRYELVEAEKARVLGDPLTAMERYDRAIAGAQENGYIQYVALAYELAGQFYLHLGRELIAQTYLPQAHYCYQRWGAWAKVQHLEWNYPQFWDASTTSSRGQGNLNLDATTDHDPHELDLRSVIKASQTLAAEIVLDDLLAKLIQIVMENAGAQIGYLILDQEGDLFIKAHGQGQKISVWEPVLVNQSQPLPLSVINYVARTQENVVINDAIAQELFSHDPYIQKSQPRSILCTPIVNLGELLGLIYLENNLTTAAFSDHRLEIINILCSQAAISLKNATLYQEMKTLNVDLEQTKEELAETNRNLEQKVQERTKSLSETLDVLKATQAELQFENQLLRREQDFTDYDYQVGGSLAMDAPTYVVRSADRYLYKALKEGQFCYILNPRQMGKSSLMVHMMHYLETHEEGFRCAAIDLTRIGSEQVTPNQWYKGLAVELWQRFDLLTTVNLKQWWEQYADLSPLQRFSQFLEEVILTYVGVEADKQIVIFIDEIDCVLNLNFSVNEFFALLRACYNQRSLNPKYQRLTFVLLGVATPSDLINDPEKTPFNIGEKIWLQGFKHHEAQPLLQGLTQKVDHPQTVLREVLAWTNGQPFLTQKICRLIRNSDDTIPADQEAQWVQQLVWHHIIEHWETQDEPEHLRTIRDRVINSYLSRTKLLNLYQQILEQGKVPVSETPEEQELLLSGLIEQQQGYLQVKNPIYETIFNQAWLRQHQTAT